MLDFFQQLFYCYFNPLCQSSTFACLKISKFLLFKEWAHFTFAIFLFLFLNFFFVFFLIFFLINFFLRLFLFFFASINTDTGIIFLTRKLCWSLIFLSFLYSFGSNLTCIFRIRPNLWNLIKFSFFIVRLGYRWFLSDCLLTNLLFACCFHFKFNFLFFNNT